MKVLAQILCGMFVVLLLPTAGSAFKLKLNSKEDVCVYFPDGAIIRRPGTCTETIKCKDGNSTPHTVRCTGDKIVKLDKMTCSADTAKSPEKYCLLSCTKSSPTYVASTRNCSAWAECERGKLLQSGSCPYGQVFNQDRQSCIYEDEDNECDKSFHICDVAKTNQPFWDKNNCQRYYFCNAKKTLKTARCAISTYYDAKSGKCISKTQVDCYKHPVPENGCGTPKLAISNRFIDDKATCRGYFYCSDNGLGEDGNHIPDEDPVWGQCAPGEFFDEENESCRDMNQVKCNEDRCDSIESGVVLSETEGCQHFLTCQEGYTIAENQCPNNQFFDPTQGLCVDEPQEYPICRKIYQ